MEYLIGCTIAAFIALTGVGAGTITTPMLLLFLGVPAAEAVTTGLLFSAAVKLLLVPAQVVRGNVNWRVLGAMLLGGVPGVLLGSLVLAHLVTAGARQLINGSLGAVLVLTAVYQLAYSFRKVPEEHTGSDRARLLPWLMLPVGAEVGFSSAGAGALGTAALLSLTTLKPAQVVGTDICFGFLLSLIGSGAHLLHGQVPGTLLLHLVLGGLVGVAAGTWGSAFIPRRPLRLALWVWLFVIGAQIVYRSLTA